MSPFSNEQREQLDQFCADLYNMEVQVALDGMTEIRQTYIDDAEFPEIIWAKLDKKITAAEAIYLAGSKILEKK